MRDLQTLKTQFRVGDFVTWQANGALVLNPSFQRRPVWKKGAKSYLIDTILRGLPVPIIFLRDLPTDLKTLRAKRDVVDGQQRLRTILSFVDLSLIPDPNQEDDFTISKAHNPEFAGKRFADLGSETQQRVLDYQFSVHSFPSDTDDRELLQIFARMNSTGLKLNAQELRNAEFSGWFKQTSYTLATEQLARWRRWKVFSEGSIARMDEVEITSEFMILIVDGVLEKTPKIITDYYDNYELLGEDKPLTLEIVSDRVRDVFECLQNSFGDDVIAEYFSTRSLFFALFCAVHGLRYGFKKPAPRRYNQVTKMKPTPLSSSDINHIKDAGRRIKLRQAPDIVLQSLRGATAHAKERQVVISYLIGKGGDLWREGN